MRCALGKMLSEKDVSAHTQAEMTECMEGKADEEKERLAVLLMDIVSTSSSEEEMINRSKELE